MKKSKSYVPVAKLKNNLRRIHQHCPQKAKAKARAKIDIATFKCEVTKCKNGYYEGKSDKRFEEIRDKWKDSDGFIIEKGKIELDHQNPVVDVKRGFGTWDDYINSLWIASEDYTNMCRSCHAEKSAKEAGERKESGSLKRKNNGH